MARLVTQAMPTTVFPGHQIDEPAIGPLPVRDRAELGELALIVFHTWARRQARLGQPGTPFVQRAGDAVQRIGTLPTVLQIDGHQFAECCMTFGWLARQEVGE